MLAGGTLQPFSHITSQLLGTQGRAVEAANAQKSPLKPLVTFSCGHVIPGENLLALVLTKTASNQSLIFDYQHRSQPKLVRLHEP